MRFTSFKMIKRAFTITVFISASFLNSYAQLDDTSKGKTAVTASDYIGTYGSDEYFCAGGPCRDVCVFEIDKTPNKYYCRWYVNGDLLETDQATLFADPKFTYDININGSYKVIEAKIYTSAWVYLEVHKWYVNLEDVNLNLVGKTSVCQGDVETYSVTPPYGITQFLWEIPAGWSGTSNSETISLVIGSSPGDILCRTVIPNNPNCWVGDGLTVSVNNLPAQPGTITGSTSVCQGSSQTYSIEAVSGATSYTWTLPSGWSGSSTTTSITTTAGASGGTISVTANSSCGTSTSRTLSVSVTTIPSQPGAISGETNVTIGQSYTYSIGAVSGATSYSWTIPYGWSGGTSTTNSITVTAGANGGDISVTANNNCGSSTPRMLTVASACNPPAQPGTISGEINVTPGQSYNYRIETVSGATSYSWTIPSGWSGSSTTNSITVTAGANGGDISVIANNNCGSSSPSILNVNLIIDCTVPEITIKWDDVLICSNIDNIFLSYQWFNGTIPIPGANEQYYVTSKQPGIYKVETIDRNGCREMSNEITVTGSKSLTVYPNPAKSSFTVSIIDQPVGKVNLRIINSTGMKIMDIETEKADIKFLKEIPSDDLEEGFYIVQVIIDQTYLYNSKILIIK